MDGTIAPITDPYRRCNEGCPHDLANGVLVEDLLSADGPYTDVRPILLFPAFPVPASPATAPAAATG